MPLYRMIIHGRGKFDLGRDEDGNGHEANGFYTTRWCRAASEERAIEKVLMRLNAEWTTGCSAHMNQCHPLKLEIEKIWRIGVLEIWRAPNRGHTFYDEAETS
jgi:hypothetical protein